MFQTNDSIKELILIQTVKNYRKLALVAGASCAVFFASLPVSAQDKAEVFTPEQKAAIQEMFKDYLMKNGEVILSSVDEFRKTEEVKSQQSAQENLKLYKDYFASKDLPSAGNPDGDVTVVEFFDYNCGYCKRAYADITKLLDEDKNIRVVFQEMPILSPSSNAMAELSHAAHMQGKYFEFHKAMMEYQGPQTPEDFMALGTKIGLDSAKIEPDAKSQETKDAIAKSMKIGRDLGIRGTPGFVIGDTIYPGYIGYDGMKAAIADIRSGKTGKTEQTDKTK